MESFAREEDKPPPVLSHPVIRQLKDRPGDLVPKFLYPTHELIEERLTSISEPGNVFHHHGAWASLLDETRHIADKLIPGILPAPLACKA
jgi:hypothetical protein